MTSVFCDFFHKLQVTLDYPGGLTGLRINRCSPHPTKYDVLQKNSRTFVN
jgi:hypothetical protein